MTVYLTIPMTSQRLSHVWRTTIQETIEGGEKRSSLFTWPRVNLENKIKLFGNNKQAFIHSSLWRDIFSIWNIPIRSDKTTLTAQATSGQKVLAIVETDYRHFYPGRDCVLINPADWEDYEVGTIDTIDSSVQITLVDNLIATWPSDTLIFPLYGFRIPQDQKIDSSFYKENHIDINTDEAFESQRDFTYTLPTIDTSIFPVYNTLNLFLKRPRNPISEVYIQPYDMFGDIGLKTPFSTFDDTRISFNRKFQFTSKKEISDYLDFFDAKQGRLGTFYAPTWMTDIIISAPFNSGDTTLTTEKIYFTQAEMTGRHVFIKFPDGTYAARAISDRPTETSITIGSPIGTTISSDLLKHVKTSFLYQVRFDQDEMALEYQSFQQEIARSDLSFKSIQ